MKAKDIKVGVTYIAKVSGNLVPVRVDNVREVGAWTGQYKGTGRTVYDVTNLRTKRKLVFRSAAKFRRPTISLATSTGIILV